MTLDMQKKKKLLAHLDAQESKKNLAHRLQEDAIMLAGEMDSFFDQIGVRGDGDDENKGPSLLSSARNIMARVTVSQGRDSAVSSAVTREGSGVAEEKKE